MFGLALLAARPFLPGLFDVTPDVARLLLAVLLVAAVQQPVSGVVFVLDGVLIGAGDQDYLAVAGLITLAVFGRGAWPCWCPAAAWSRCGLAFTVWMLARLVTLTLRARGSRWLVTGAVRG